MSRRVLLILLPTLFISSLAAGQSLKIGITGGLNLSSVQVSQTPNQYREPVTNESGLYKPGGSIGIVLEKKLIGKLYIVTNGIFSYNHTYKSYTYTYYIDSEPIFTNHYDQRIRANIFEIPVMLKLNNPLNFKFPINLMGGASLGWVFNIKYERNNILNSGSRFVNFKLYDTNPYDFGLTGGLGIDLLKNVSFDVRYTQGLSSFYTDPDVFENGTIKSRFFTFQLTYYFYAK